jgi:hypothetical protein
MTADPFECVVRTGPLTTKKRRRGTRKDRYRVECGRTEDLQKAANLLLGGRLSLDRRPFVGGFTLGLWAIAASLGIGRNWLDRLWNMGLAESGPTSAATDSKTQAMKRQTTRATTVVKRTSSPSGINSNQSIPETPGARHAKSTGIPQRPTRTRDCVSKTIQRIWAIRTEQFSFSKSGVGYQVLRHVPQSVRTIASSDRNFPHRP